MPNFLVKFVDIEINLEEFPNILPQKKRHSRLKMILFSSQIMIIILLDMKNIEKDNGLKILRLKKGSKMDGLNR